MSVFDQEIMARTALGEARSEGELAMKGVMWTGVNRFTAKRWFSEHSIAGTFLKYEQYDCWMPKDPNYTLITNVTPLIPLLSAALMWAQGIIRGDVPDPTQGATHYFDDSITPPDWAATGEFTVKLGRLSFYKNVA